MVVTTVLLDLFHVDQIEETDSSAIVGDQESHANFPSSSLDNRTPNVHHQLDPSEDSGLMKKVLPRSTPQRPQFGLTFSHVLSAKAELPAGVPVRTDSPRPHPRTHPGYSLNLPSASPSST